MCHGILARQQLVKFVEGHDMQPEEQRCQRLPAIWPCIEELASNIVGLHKRVILSTERILERKIKKLIVPLVCR
jgi:hypothetical protein